MFIYKTLPFKKTVELTNPKTFPQFRKILKRNRSTRGKILIRARSKQSTKSWVSARMTRFWKKLTKQTAETAVNKPHIWVNHRSLSAIFTSAVQMSWTAIWLCRRKNWRILRHWQLQPKIMPSKNSVKFYKMKSGQKNLRRWSSNTAIKSREFQLTAKPN